MSPLPSLGFRVQTPYIVLNISYSSPLYNPLYNPPFRLIDPEGPESICLVHTITHTHINTGTEADMYMRTCAYIYMYVHIYVYACVYMYIHICVFYGIVLVGFPPDNSAISL